MFLALVKSSLIHLLQAVVNNVLLDKALVQCHTSTLTTRMFLMVPQGPSPQNSLQLSIVLMKPQLVVHRSYICGECNLLYSEL